jgi:hypothetical protein
MGSAVAGKAYSRTVAASETERIDFMANSSRWPRPSEVD